MNSSFLVSFFQHHLNHFLETQLLSTSISSLTQIETVRIIARHSMSWRMIPILMHIFTNQPIYSLHCILFECHFLRLLICLHQSVCVISDVVVMVSGKLYKKEKEKKNSICITINLFGYLIRLAWKTKNVEEQ